MAVFYQIRSTNLTHAHLTENFVKTTKWTLKRLPQKHRRNKIVEFFVIVKPLKAVQRPLETFNCFMKIPWQNGNIVSLPHQNVIEIDSIKKTKFPCSYCECEYWKWQKDILIWSEFGLKEKVTIRIKGGKISEDIFVWVHEELRRWSRKKLMPYLFNFDAGFWGWLYQPNSDCTFKSCRGPETFSPKEINQESINTFKSFSHLKSWTRKMLVPNENPARTCTSAEETWNYVLVWSASTHLTEYSLTSFFILTLVLARTQVASTKQVTSGASFELSK